MSEPRTGKKTSQAEALTVLLLCLFLLATAPPACRRAQDSRGPGTRIAHAKAMCAANLAAVGKAMTIYANDYEGQFPRAGGPGTVWGGAVIWNAQNSFVAYGLAADGGGGRATISASFYLLVKYAEITPRAFICPGDLGTSEFKLADVPQPSPDARLSDLWDFGPAAYKHNSFSYHMPYSRFALTRAGDPNMPVAADRNPWIDSPAADGRTFAEYPFIPDCPPYNGPPERARLGNANSHGLDGQNVLFVDGRVEFEERSYCGLDKDNTYRYVLAPIGGGRPMSDAPPRGGGPIAPGNEQDSLLVHDPPVFATYGSSAPARP